MFVNLEKLLVEVSRNARTSLQVGGSGGFFGATPSTVGISFFSCYALGVGFFVPGDAIMADHEKFPREKPRRGSERR
jgi:hypothetical protein